MKCTGNNYKKPTQKFAAGGMVKRAPNKRAMDIAKDKAAQKSTIDRNMMIMDEDPKGPKAKGRVLTSNSQKSGRT